MLLTFKPGDVVTYVDETGNPHNALVKYWWGPDERSACNLSYIDSTEPPYNGFEPRTLHRKSIVRGPVVGSSYWQPLGEPVTTVDSPAGKFWIPNACPTTQPPQTSAAADLPEAPRSVVYNGPVYFGPVYFGYRKPEPQVVHVEIGGADDFAESILARRPSAPA